MSAPFGETPAVIAWMLRNALECFSSAYGIEVSASLIVLVIRTRLPFFRSLTGKYLSVATAFVAAFVLALPWMPFAGLLGFTTLPLEFYGWMLPIVIGGLNHRGHQIGRST